MKAIQISETGSVDVLKLKEVTIRELRQGEALIKIKYAGVNFIDIYQRKGIYPVELPFIPGYEASGIVEEVGEGVTHVKPGDAVAYVHELGCYAEKKIVDANYLIPLPKEIPFEIGASFPLQAMTAHYLLHEYKTLKKGDIVLIHAAAGGMGLILTEWAKKLGCFVIGTVSNEEKAKVVKEKGADEVIIYTQENFQNVVKKITNGYGADLIIDGVGKETFQGNLEASAFKGHILIFGSSSGAADPILPNALMPKCLTISGGTLFNYILTRDELMMRASHVMKGIIDGWLNLRIDKIYPLKDASEAQFRLEERKSIGKILLKP